MKSRWSLPGPCRVWLRELRYDWLPWLVFAATVAGVIALYREATPRAVAPDSSSLPAPKVAPAPPPVPRQTPGDEPKLVEARVVQQFTNYSQNSQSYSPPLSAKGSTNKSLAEFERARRKTSE